MECFIALVLAEFSSSRQQTLMVLSKHYHYFQNGLGIPFHTLQFDLQIHTLLLKERRVTESDPFECQRATSGSTLQQWG